MGVRRQSTQCEKTVFDCQCHCQQQNTLQRTPSDLGCGVVVLVVVGGALDGASVTGAYLLRGLAHQVRVGELMQELELAQELVCFSLSQ
jgi:hypothetical protein